MPNFLPLTTVSLTSVTYPGPANVVLAFVPDSWAFITQSKADDILVSFDGVTDHLPLTPGKSNEAMTVGTQAQSVWFRRAHASTTAERVIVMASGS